MPWSISIEKRVTIMALLLTMTGKKSLLHDFTSFLMLLILKCIIYNGANGNTFMKVWGY